MPFFSIVIPSYNRADRISNTVRSVLDQTFKDFELIIVDDGSTDGTKELVSSFNDPRIHYFRKSNEERGAARNAGVKLAKGEFVTFLDSDDLLYLIHLQTAYSLIQKKNDASFFHLPYFVSKNGKKNCPSYPSAPDLFRTKLFEGNYLSCQGVFLRKTIALDNPFHENRKMAGMEDWELWLRISTKHDLHIGETYTSELVDHSDRSVRGENIQTLREKVLYFLSHVLNSEYIKMASDDEKKRLKSSCYSYIALHIALTKKNRRETIRYTIKSILEDPSRFFSRRTLAIIKHFF